jgi:hypothetical protein
LPVDFAGISKEKAMQEYITKAEQVVETYT